MTLLQRSPTYFYCSENRNELADRLREVGIDEPFFDIGGHSLLLPRVRSQIQERLGAGRLLR